MSWLLDKFKAGLIKKPRKPGEQWVECPKCLQNNFRADLERNLRVCPKCDYHHRLTAMERIYLVVNNDSFTQADMHLISSDPLKFKDKKRYKERIKASLKKSDSSDAIISGTASIGSHRVEICSFSFDFMGGSMGSVVGEKIARSVERAIKNRHPLIIFSCSGGARMQEGIFSLMQMAKTSTTLQQLSEQSILYISVLTDPTMGGVSASFAMLGDVIIAEPGALIGFAGPRVIEQTIQQKLPEGFQTAEFLLDNGLIDNVVHRRDMREILENLLNLFNPKPRIVDNKKNHS